VPTFAAADPVMLRYVWTLPAIMAGSFVVILFFGKRLKYKGAEIGIAAVVLCFLLALVSAGSWFGHVDDAKAGTTATSCALPAAATTLSPGVGQVSQHGGPTAEVAPAGSATQAGEPAAPETGGEVAVQPVCTSQTWFHSGGVEVKVGTLVDGLSVMMLVVVTLISSLVHIYSTDYVGGDRRYTHYFAFLSLFTASMLMLVMSRNTIQFITSWELVGLCSFALIGHWWEEKPNSDAALKAFLTNRVGDIGLMIGMITLFFATGTFDIFRINQLADTGGARHFLLLVAALCLIGAVMSKSGQFILHTWLPDAMAGPTPVSALIHAATMVVAGVFMVARLYGVFFNGLSIGSGHLNALAVVGAVTVIGGAGLAFVQNDIKKVLAYSTVSQLGYMVMALGVGAWTAAIFHLFTHAFFKAGLFLGSGSVAHSVHSFDMKEDMGGMKKFMPKTFWTFIICTAALIGIFPLAGFWSKDEILAGAWHNGAAHDLRAFTIVGLVGAMMTAAYMTRCIYLTFFGEPRGVAADPHHHPHESGPRIVYPLYILSGLAIVAGFANFPGAGFPFNGVPGAIADRFEHFVEPRGDYFPAVTNGFTHAPFLVVIALASVFVFAGIGIGLAYAYYWNGRLHGATERSAAARWGHTVLVNKYYFDTVYTDGVAAGTKGQLAQGANWFNQNVLDGVVNGLAFCARFGAGFVYRYVDQGAIDGTINGAARGTRGVGGVLRQMQTGKVQQYGTLLFGGAVILGAIFIFAI
jgi:NADH-quinone oxidoreductase subunit L